MGYYSDVMLITNIENKDTVEAIFDSFKGSGNPQNILEWADIKDGFTWVVNDWQGIRGNDVELIMWQWSGMRWGYGFTRTDEIEEALVDILTYKDDNFNFPAYAHFGLIVIGEDLDDTRLVGNPAEYGMSVTRTISW